MPKRFTGLVEYLLDCAVCEMGLTADLYGAFRAFVPGDEFIEALSTAQLSKDYRESRIMFENLLTARGEQVFWRTRRHPEWATFLADGYRHWQDTLNDMLNSMATSIVDKMYTFSPFSMDDEIADHAEQIGVLARMGSHLERRRRAFDPQRSNRRMPLFVRYDALPRLVGDRSLGGVDRSDESRRERKARRKAVVRSIELAKSVLGEGRTKLLTRGKATTIASGRFDYVVTADSPLQSGHGSLQVEVWKGSEKAARLCVYVEDTPAFDQAAAFSIMVAAGCEEELVYTANIMGSEDTAAAREFSSWKSDIHVARDPPQPTREEAAAAIAEEAKIPWPMHFRGIPNRRGSGHRHAKLMFHSAFRQEIAPMLEIRDLRPPRMRGMTIERLRSLHTDNPEETRLLRMDAQDMYVLGGISGNTGWAG